MKVFVPTFIMLSITLLGFIFYTTPQAIKKKKPVAEKPGVSTALRNTIREYEELINDFFCREGPPGAAIAIVKDDSIVYLQGFGIKDLNTEKPVDMHTVFRLGSISKPFASMLVGIMVEDHLFSWDDPVVRYIDDFMLKSADQTSKVTLKHLLSHTTGLPYHAYSNLIEEGEDLSSLIKKLRNVNLISPVGKLYSYQNVAFSVIGKVVESVTKKSFEANMEERVFKPLNMNDASMSYEALIENPNVAQPYLRSRRKWKKIPISKFYYNVPPAGGVNASIKDMAKWMQALLGNREDIISVDMLNQLFKPVVKTRSKNKNFKRWKKINRSYYGLGWRIVKSGKESIVYHGGYVNGYRSELGINLKEKIGICVLANGPGNFSNRAIPYFFNVYDKYRNKKIVKKKPII